MKDRLVELSPYLAVMTQANAGNRGFHTIGNYTRADYVCIAEHEMRLVETRPRRSIATHGEITRAKAWRK